MIITKTKSIELNFGREYYVEDVDAYNIPAKSGVYCVYAGTFDKNNMELTKIRKLLYIGQSGEKDGMYGRLTNHDKKEEFLEELKQGESLCYACAVVENKKSRDMAEAAMIYQHRSQLELNDIFTNNYPYDKVTIHVEGDATIFLDKKFTVGN